MKDELDDFLSPEVENCVEETIEIKQKGPSLFDYISDITENKKNLAFDIMTKTGVFPKDANPFMFLKALGNYKDCVLFANEMNIRYFLTPETQYQFYLYTIPKKKRYAKWYKPDTSKDDIIAEVSTYYGWSKRETELNLHMLSKDDIKQIQSIINAERIEKTNKRKKSKK